LESLPALSSELALVTAFAAGVTVTAAVFSRDAGVLGGVPLPPLPNAVRLSPAAAPDVVVTGAGVIVLQHLLNYFYPGARAAGLRYARAVCRKRLTTHALAPRNRACNCARDGHSTPHPAGAGAAAERDAA
jgi:hypothetical protein